MRLGLFFKFVVSKTTYHKAIITTTKCFYITQVYVSGTNSVLDIQTTEYHNKCILSLIMICINLNSKRGRLKRELSEEPMMHFLRSILGSRLCGQGYFLSSWFLRPHITKPSSLPPNVFISLRCTFLGQIQCLIYKLQNTTINAFSLLL